MEPALVCCPPIPELATSDDVTAAVNGQDVWVEKYTSNLDNASLPGWFPKMPYTSQPQQVNIANFACSGPMRITITARESIEAFVIRPKSRKIQAVKEGRKLTFSLPGPDKLYIDINRLPPLCVEENVLKAFELHITKGTIYGLGPPGHIKDVHLKDIAWESEKPIILKGLDDEHIVENVVFENCSVSGEPLRSANAGFVRVNQFVKNVTFK